MPRTVKLKLVAEMNMLASSTVENYLKAIYRGAARPAPRSAASADGPTRRRRRRRARHGDDDGEDAGRVGAGGIRAVCRGGADRGRAETRRARPPPSSPHRAVSRAGHGLLVGRGARRSRTARARRHRSPDRSHRRDARTARDGSARRSDSQRRRTGEAAGRADAAHLPAGDDCHCHARDRSGQGVPALHRAAIISSRARRSRSKRATRRPTASASAARTISASRSARGPHRSCWCRSRQALLLCLACVARVRADGARTPRGSADEPLRLHGLPLQQAGVRRTACSTSTASSCWSRHTFSPRIRFVGELELEHAFVEGLEEGGELELEQAYVDFLLDAQRSTSAPG